MQTGAPGGVVTYSATATAPASNSAAEYLNGDSFNVSGATLNDSGFFNNFPLFLDPGQSFTGTLFTLTLDNSDIPGSIYPGSFTLLGGSTASTYESLATVNFTTTVASSVATTPEPSSLLLLSTGVLGAALLFLRRRPASLSSAA